MNSLCPILPSRGVHERDIIETVSEKAEESPVFPSWAMNLAKMKEDKLLGEAWSSQSTEFGWIAD